MDGYTWQYTGADGAPTGASTAFPTQGEAEAFIGEEWQLLLEDGVENVTLVQGDTTVYGPMSLREAQ